MVAILRVSTGFSKPKILTFPDFFLTNFQLFLTFFWPETGICQNPNLNWLFRGYQIRLLEHVISNLSNLQLHCTGYLSIMKTTNSECHSNYNNE